MSESTESVKRLLTAISKNATDSNIIDLVRIFDYEYNEKQLRQDIKAIDFVDIIDRPGSREQLEEKEDPAARDETEGSYFIRQYVLDHPEVSGANFVWYDLYEYTGHVTGTGDVNVFVHVRSKDSSIETRDREVLIDWTYLTKSSFDDFFKDPVKAYMNNTVYFGDWALVFGYVEPPKGSSPDHVMRLFANTETGSFTSYKEFIRDVKAELEYKGHTDYEILD